VKILVHGSADHLPAKVSQKSTTSPPQGIKRCNKATVVQLSRLYVLSKP